MGKPIDIDVERKAVRFLDNCRCYPEFAKRVAGIRRGVSARIYVTYGFPHLEDTEDKIKKNLIEYRKFKEKLVAEHKPLPVTPLQCSPPLIKEFSNHTVVKNDFDEQVQTMESFLKQIQEHRTLWSNEGSKVIVPRTRRKIEEGSYPNFSVDEDKLPTLLRFTWKAKLNKLKKYLKNSSKHKKINLQDSEGRYEFYQTFC